VITDCSGQHTALDVTPLPDKYRGAVRMRYRLDILMNDRTFVEVGSHIMRSRTDHLHAAGVSLVIRFGALEARQEAVMNVDASAGQKASQVIRQNLHIPGKDDEFGAAPLDQRLDQGFLGRLARSVARSLPGTPNRMRVKNWPVSRSSN